MRYYLIPSFTGNGTNKKRLFLPIIRELSKFITCPICLPNNECWYEEDKPKYKIAYSKDVLEKDFPAIPPTVRSRIIKAIEEKLTTDPLRAGIPVRGKLKKD